MINTALALSAAAAAVSPDGIERLSPSAFSQLSKPIRHYLERRRCTIPQSDYGEGQHNVIRGRFIVPYRRDWAVLCSRDGSSTILVFAPGRPTPVAEIGHSKDSHYLQSGGGDKAGFSHSIRVATKRQILSYRNTFGGWVPSPLDLEGIDDSFDGKASVVLYRHRGKWVELQGMD